MYTSINSVMNAVLSLRYYILLPLQDDNGLRPIHVCAYRYIKYHHLKLQYYSVCCIYSTYYITTDFLNFYSNFAEGARLLLEHGAESNSKDGRENTAAMAAGALGHFEILEVLLGHRLLNIHAGVRQRHSHCVHLAIIIYNGSVFYSEVSLFQGLKCMQE